MPHVAKLGRVAGAVALALGVTANAHAAAALEWTASILDQTNFLLREFTIASLIDHKVTLVDNNFSSTFDSLALGIIKTGSGTIQTLTAPGEFTFTPAVTGSYTAVVFGETDTLSTFGVTVAAVPEAETWAMMLVGMGLVGWQLRRKVKASAASRFV